MPLAIRSKWKEAIETLQGKGPEDLQELCLVLASKMVLLAGGMETEAEARERLIEVIENGKALEAFKQFLKAQGGDPTVVDDFDKLAEAKYQIKVKTVEHGFVSEIIADEIGMAAMMLGAGRETKESKIDLSVGVVLHKKIGDHIEKGNIIATIHSNKGRC